MVRGNAYIIMSIILSITILSITGTLSSSQITVEDSLHRTIVLDKTPERVVSLAPSITEILFALDLEKYIVGVDSISYNDTYFGINRYVVENNIPSVGGYWWSAISLEKIISLEPDLVLADAGAHYKLLDSFNEYNITVVYLHGGSARSIQDIYYDIDLVGKIFGLDKSRVSNLIRSIEENITKARNMINSIGINRNIRILVIVGFYNGIWVAGKSTFIDDLITRIGLENAADNIGWYVINIEELSSLDPDLIIVTNMGYVTNETLEEYGLTGLGKPVILLSQKETDLITRPGPLIGYGAIILASKIKEQYSGTIVSEKEENIVNNIVNYMVTGIIAVVSLVAGFILGIKLKR